MSSSASLCATHVEAFRSTGSSPGRSDLHHFTLAEDDLPADLQRALDRAEVAACLTV